MPGADLIAALLPGRQGSWRLSIGVTVLVWAMIGAGRPDLLTLDAADFTHDHALLSIDIAINRAYCDSPSKVSNRFRLPYEARDRAELRQRPVSAVLNEVSGSIERYCLTVGSPIVNNENSLMWIESWLFRIMPRLSLDGLAGALHAMHLAGVALLTVVAARAGAGALMATALTVAALVMLGRLDSLAITVYPADFVLLLVNAAMAAAVATTTARRHARSAVLLAIGLGLFASFGGNLRTSHWPIYASLPLLALLWAERPFGRAAALARAALLIAGFVVGYIAFQQLAINRHLPDGFAESAHHTTWHSTVIGLAVPENDLSRRERLAWSDGAAWELAKSIDPSVRYISKEYEQVLRGYYFGLWQRERSAMIGVYSLKLQTAGPQMIDVLRGAVDRDGPWTARVLGPATLLSSGAVFLLVYLALTATGAVLTWTGRRGGSLLLALAATAVFLHLESVVVTSLYVPQYHAYLAFAILAASLSIPVFALVAGGRWLRRPGPARQ
jgi:hypothetical protein